jgi:hypothetical protein
MNESLEKTRVSPKSHVSYNYSIDVWIGIGEYTGNSFLFQDFMIATATAAATSATILVVRFCGLAIAFGCCTSNRKVDLKRSLLWYLHGCFILNKLSIIDRCATSSSAAAILKITVSRAGHFS